MKPAVKCLWAMVLYSTLIFAAETEMPLVLKAPLISEGLITGYRVGLRPYRSLGIRIEKENQGEKLIIHNYGHGGAGISMSWGSAQAAIGLLPNRSKEETIAVIGAGVIGLATAIILSDLGYKVHIYAQEVTPNTTSDVAGAHFSPFLVAHGESESAQQQFAHIKEISEKYFRDLAQSSNPRFAGVSLVKAYSFHSSECTEHLRVSFDNGKTLTASIDETILIDTGSYLASLMKQVEERNIAIQRVKLVKQDIPILKEGVIFNCSGLGASELFNDKDLKPIRGHLIEITKQEGINYFAYADSNSDSDYFTCLFPHQNKILIGGSIEKDQWCDEVDKKVCDQIISDAKKLFGQRL